MALLVLLLVFCLSASAEGRTWHDFNGFQYSIEINPVNSYADAELECSALQAKLVNIKTVELFSFLKKFITSTEQPYPFYIGAKKIGNTNKFQWNDGSPVSKYLWQRGEPNNLGGGENCVTMGYGLDRVSSYLWYDVPCTRHRARYICEKVIDLTTTLPSSNQNTATNLLSAKPYPGIIFAPTKPYVTVTTKQSPTGITTKAETKVDRRIVIIASSTCGGVNIVITLIVIAIVTFRKRKRRSKTPGRYENETAYVNMTENRQTSGTQNLHPIYVNDSVQPSMSQQQADDIQPYEEPIQTPPPEYMTIDP